MPTLHNSLPGTRPRLWCDHLAEQAAQFCIGIFPNFKIVNLAQAFDG